MRALSVGGVDCRSSGRWLAENFKDQGWQARGRMHEIIGTRRRPGAVARYDDADGRRQAARSETVDPG